ncbi:MAG: RNA polymerase sigma factor [Calditrichaeota bacterium]|nr:RNA polymerase sigma factor [Calditrichota bacterium]
MDQNTIVECDNATIRRYLDSKDVKYLGKLYETYKRVILLHCLRMVNHEEDAKDLASEAFIRAFDHIESFKLGAPFLPWLRRIATNLCIDHLRKKNRHKFYEFNERHSPVAIENENEIKESVISQERILEILNKLKPLQKRCFCLFYVHSLTYKQIAEMTGYPLGKVRSYIQNGKRNFKLLMEKQ